MGCFSFFSKNRGGSDAGSIKTESTLVEAAFDSEKARKSDAAAVLPTVKRDLTGPRLSALRKLMEQEELDFYLVPTDDAHATEYTAASEMRRVWISGFTGSAGTAVVGKDSAHLFADGRYHIQAAEQLDDNWTLHKVGVSGVLDWPAWLIEQAEEGTKVGLDPALTSYTQGKSLVASLQQKQASAVFPSRNLVDVAWGSDRPAPVAFPIYEHELKYAGKPATAKIEDVQKDLQVQPASSAYFISALDEVAWLLNLRGASIPCHPVFPAYLLIASDRSTLFIRSELLPAGTTTDKYVRDTLNINVEPYDSVWEYLSRWSSEGSDGQKLISGEKLSYAVANAVGDEKLALLDPWPVALRKSIKNDVELEGFRASHIRDGAAWVRWAAWLEDHVKVKRENINEWEAAVKFQEYRKMLPLYAGDSYDAISATGPNAALPHYETPEKGSRVIDRETPYLNDSGAQYHDGTIDCTRTVHFGRPSAEQKRAYTRVLQGHIRLSEVKFPAGTTGAQLDPIARHALWQDGYQYLHGTGHGIGSFLDVHEGPQGFSTMSGGSKQPVALEENMVLTNEPGFYEEGHFGIRTESLLAVKRVETHREFGDVAWYGFERITQVPIATNLVDFSLLSYSEVRWLKEHNAEVRKKLLPLIKDDKRAVRWLRRQ
ncbi:putative aminopeptidase P, cytoplasmic [Mycosarcoma maydis]|uniref:Aminopeptidase P, cytoplasmic n=1 Tax=Mycosarcoma maydis TaxID=5270 RepID=A0A0D1EAG0_MYCMD|nr:putative aminopeptidase P, cytoplasmic [Ustilago maydis 521]KIS71370.1 putative aminopeptidase P, cytoplasmic [Ustilago maydis 521]|eukprot:XP_011387193.1 putative aminopeptidase P, cytoplasmic [Ustilago maydis 521]